MKINRHSETMTILAWPTRLILTAMILVLTSGIQVSEAQWSFKWVHVGDLHHPYTQVGFASENLIGTNPLWMYPALYHQHPESRNTRGEALWISARNVRSIEGDEYAVRISHMGPRSPGLGEMFPVEQRLVSNFPAPEVRVDGFDTFLRPVIVDEVDEDQDADRILYTTFNTSVGITVEQTVRAFSLEDHQTYHIIEYVFTNTGFMEEGTGEPDVIQTLEDVYFTLHSRNAISGHSAGRLASGGSYGRPTMNDIIVEGDLRAAYSWFGDVRNRSWNQLGGPLVINNNHIIEADTVGRLSAAYMLGTLTLHADRDVDDPNDDPDQPRVMTWLDVDDASLTGANDHYNHNAMLTERTWLESGSGRSLRESHARIVVPEGPFSSQTADPFMGMRGGIAHVESYGPYTMEHGESIRIVLAKVAAGLSNEAAFHIGREWKRSGMDDDLLIPYEVNGEVHELTKNQWAVDAARDSLLHMFEKVRENYASGFAIPEPPRPPSRFEVTSGTDQVFLDWDSYAGHEPAGGWEIWRAQNRYDGIPVPDEASAYQLVASLPASARNYEDSEVSRGVSYYYYIQAVGEVNNNGTAMTRTGVPLKSNRNYTQTYEPAFLKRPPGGTLEAARVVPNPYNLASDANVRWPDVQDRLGFLDIPGNATIRIFTMLGEHVETIEHTDGSGDAFWDLTTLSRQVVVSGHYIAYIEDNDTGESIIRKFIIIR